MTYQFTFGGSNDAYWLSTWSYTKEILLPKEKTPILDSFLEISKEVFWWIPYNGIVLYSEKPLEMHFKDGKLHNTKGPSVLFRDGYSLYSIEGTSGNSLLEIKADLILQSTET